MEKTKTATAASEMVPKLAKIRDVRSEVHDVFSIYLAMDNPFPFHPGQFTMVYLFGTGEVPISISGDPATSHTLVHTIRAVGRVTRPMMHLQAGQMLGIRGPYGNPWPMTDARGKDVILIAGGLGLAPLRPVLYAIANARDRFGRVSLLYGARSPDDILYADQLTAWHCQDIEVLSTVDHAGPKWHGHVGLVTQFIPKLQIDIDNTIAMVCGPEIMMRFAMRELRYRGLADTSIYLSLERNMQCAIGLCGHCQYGPSFVCKDGPVYRADKIAKLFTVREL